MSGTGYTGHTSASGAEEVALSHNPGQFSWPFTSWHTPALPNRPRAGTAHPPFHRAKKRRPAHRHPTPGRVREEPRI